MDARELPRTFRILMIANIVFAIMVIIVLSADYIPALGFVLNPHSLFGGVSLLVMFLITLITFGTLLFYSPKSIEMLKRDPQLKN